MKLKTLPTLVFGLCATLSVSAYEVPTTPQKKNVLLEEFTGIHCGYCPQGHTIAKNMQTAQPETVYSIAIHGGSFAIPGSDEPDFRTEAGDILNNGIGAEFYGTGYPSGMINRHVFGGTSPITGRGDWTKDGKDQSQQNAPVNLLLKSTFDGNSRELKVTVEGYYTENQQREFNLLNVAIVQSNIKGPQNGGTMGDEYIHNHMLRDFITPAWGDTIKAPKQGEYFTREYTYTLPLDIKKVELKAEDIEIIAYVCADKTEVLNVTGEKPVYSNYDKALNGVLLSPDREIKGNYAYNFFEAKIKNESDQELTSAEFQVTINGNNQTVTWNGNISSFETKPVVIKVNPYDFEVQNNYTITLTKLNGQSITGNNLTGSFTAPSECTPLLNIELQTDLYADENTFVIKDREGNIVKEFGPYQTDKKAVYKETASLEQGKIYCFEVNDQWGDGIQEPKGFYKISNQENNSMITQQYDIKLFGSRFFFSTALTSGIENNTAEKGMSIFSTTGSLEVSFIPEVSGVARIELYSVSGQFIHSITVQTSANETVNETISTTAIPNGIYLVKIGQNDKNLIVKTTIR